MSTRAQLRQALRVMIDQPENDSRFTNDELDILLNEAQKFIADVIDHPRDIISVITEQSIGAYQLPEDNLFVKQAWFGDISVKGDIEELLVISQKALSKLFPGWLETNTDNDNRPKYLIKLNKKDVFIYPKPSSTYAGKLLIISYAFTPQTMDTDDEESGLPGAYHPLIIIYAAHLCYEGKLSNPDQSKSKYGLFERKLQLLSDPVESETDASSSFEYIDVPGFF